MMTYPGQNTGPYCAQVCEAVGSSSPVCVLQEADPGGSSSTPCLTRSTRNVVAGLAAAKKHTRYDALSARRNMKSSWAVDRRTLSLHAAKSLAPADTVI